MRSLPSRWEQGCTNALTVRIILRFRAGPVNQKAPDKPSLIRGLTPLLCCWSLPQAGVAGDGEPVERAAAFGRAEVVRLASPGITAKAMEAVPVCTYVSNARNEGPQCLAS
jgi:hypothetical protein